MDSSTLCFVCSAPQRWAWLTQLRWLSRFWMDPPRLQAKYPLRGASECGGIYLPEFEISPHLQGDT